MVSVDTPNTLCYTLSISLRCTAAHMSEYRDDSWLKDLKRLLEELSQANVVRFQLDDGTTKIFIRMSTVAPTLSAATSDGSPLVDSRIPIRSPLTGVCYLAPSPRDAPFVHTCDFVVQGQVVCLIEAMKVFNEVRAPQEGRVVEILAETGGLVHQGDVLMVLEE